MRQKARFELEAEKRRGKRTVTCQVSDRYLRYERTDPKGTGFGNPVVINVMTDRGYDDKPDRKLCEMVVSLEDLEVMVAQLRADITDGH